ncbi:MAG: hypothetical protein AAGG07_00530 [Planctomycetota bacterium]
MGDSTRPRRRLIWTGLGVMAWIWIVYALVTPARVAIQQLTNAGLQTVHLYRVTVEGVEHTVPGLSLYETPPVSLPLVQAVLMLGLAVLVVVAPRRVRGIAWGGLWLWAAWWLGGVIWLMTSTGFFPSSFIIWTVPALLGVLACPPLAARAIAPRPDAATSAG